MKYLKTQMWNDCPLMDADNFFLIYVLQMPRDGQGYSTLFPFTLVGEAMNYCQWAWEGFQ